MKLSMILYKMQFYISKMQCNVSCVIFVKNMLELNKFKNQLVRKSYRLKLFSPLGAERNDYK